MGIIILRIFFNCLEECKIKKIEPVIITDDENIIKNDETFSKYKILKTSLVSRSNLIQKIYSKNFNIIIWKKYIFRQFFVKK